VGVHSFESNQSGIETEIENILASMNVGLNRTRVELKRSVRMFNDTVVSGLNRTRVELKHMDVRSAIKPVRGLNRTRVELKHSDVEEMVVRLSGLNRTRVELKPCSCFGSNATPQV